MSGFDIGVWVVLPVRTSSGFERGFGFVGICGVGFGLGLGSDVVMGAGVFSEGLGRVSGDDGLMPTGRANRANDR